MSKSRMNAIIVRSGDTFHYEKVERPQAGPGEVVLQIEAAGICAADRKIFSGQHPWQLPDLYIPGHEYVGTVVELGEGASEATGLQIGDQATAEIIVPCRACWFCTHDLYHHCDNPGFCVGAWAENLILPRGAIVYRLPDSLPPEVAVLIEPLSCSIHAVRLARIGTEDTVVISGLGTIGMGVLQVACLQDHQILIGLDVDEDLLDIAKDHGADYVFNPAKQNAHEEIRALTEGRGADIYIEVSGATVSVQTGMQVLRKAGRLVVFGVYGQPAEIDLNIISEFKELEIIGGHLSPNAYPLAIQCLEDGSIDYEMMVTHRYPLSEYERAIHSKSDKDGPSIKTILIPEG